MYEQHRTLATLAQVKSSQRFIRMKVERRVRVRVMASGFGFRALIFGFEDRFSPGVGSGTGSVLVGLQVPSRLILKVSPCCRYTPDLSR